MGISTNWIDRRSVCIAGLASLPALGACATIVRAPYSELADAGQAAALAAASLTNKFALDYRRSGIWAQVTATIAECKGTTEEAVAKGCIALVPSRPAEGGAEAAAINEEAASLIKVEQQLTARANAFTALGEAYRQLKLEAQYDARAEMQKALDGAVESLASFGAVLSKNPGTFALSQAFRVAAPAAGGIIAQNRQADRLRNANLSLEELLSRFLDLLALDSSDFDQAWAFIAENQIKALEALISQGLISPEAFISELALELGGTVAPELPEDPRMARAVAITVVRERAALAKAEQGRFFAVTAKALEGLKRAHAKAAAAQEPDLTSVTNSVLELTDFVKRIRSTGEE